MTKASAQERAGLAGSSPFPFASLAGGGGQVLEAWMAMNQSVLARLGDMQQEAVRFASQRLEEDLKGQRELVACRSPVEAAELYSTFLRKLVADYTQEAGKFAEIASDVQSTCSGFGATLAPAAFKSEAAARRT